MKFVALVGVLLSLAAGLADVALAAPDASRGQAVLERFVGDWEVQVTATKPVKLFSRYFESAVLAPGDKLLRTSTNVKPDGTQDWSMMLYDAPSGGYPLWIFTSAGAFYYLAPGRWNADTRSIVWEAPPGSPVSHKTTCTFSDERTRNCQTLVKNWKGGVLLEQSYTAIRQR